MFDLSGPPNVMEGNPTDVCDGSVQSYTEELNLLFFQGSQLLLLLLLFSHIN